MDKNSITAIALTFLLVFLYMHFYGPKPKPQLSTTNSIVKTEAAVKSTATVFESNTNATALSELPASDVSEYDGTLTETILSNNLVTFTFSSFGGDIEKIKIHRSSIVEKGPIVTINAKSNAWEVPLRIREFGKFNVNNLILKPEHVGQSDITFTGTIDKTILVKKYYKLKPNSYLLQAGMTFSNLSSGIVSVSNSFSVWLGRINTVSSKADRYTKPRSIDVCTLSDGKLKLKRIKPNKKKPLQTVSGPIEWFALKNKYFTHILIPETAGRMIGVKTIDYKKEKQVSGFINLNLAPIQPGGSVAWTSTLYAGPTDYDNLKALGTTVGRGGKYVEILNLGMFSFLAKPILVYGLKGLYKYVHNYGWAIIIITIIIKLVTWPLQTKSFTSMQKMQKVQPELKALQEKYKNDKTKLQQEMMLLYRKHGVNPMGGCLPMLLQMPIFFALFAALSRSIELWGAPFLWIKDLSLPDNVATLPFDIPFLGNGLNPLAIVMGVAMIGQQMLMPSTGDASQKRMMYLMPVIMMFFFYNAPSGLVLYWLLNQIITMGQMFYLHYLKKS